MSEEDLSGHFHTYPKTYDPNVPKLNPQNLRLAIFAKIQASVKECKFSKNSGPLLT